MKTKILNTTKYWLSDRFKENIIGDISEVKPYKKEITHFVLEKNEYDSEIIKRVETFTKEQVLALLLKLTQDENSILLKNGYANIFYVKLKDRAVVVHARLDGGRWKFPCFGLDGFGDWPAGGLVLSPAMVEPQTLETLDSLTARVAKLEAFVNGIKNL